MARTIESPGIEIKEKDLSLTANLPVGTSVFAQGYAAQGPTDELINITSMSDFEQIYGVPTNAAERYFYHTCKQILSTNATLLCNRLPYGDGNGDGYSSGYSALCYPISANDAYQSATGYTLSTPKLVQLTSDQYNNWKAGNISWTNAASGIAGDVYDVDSAGNAGLIIVNENKTTVDENYQGYYVVVADNQNLNDTDFNAVTDIMYNTASGYDTLQAIPSSVLEFSLTGSIDGNRDSISENVETIPTFDAFGSSEYKDSLVVGLFKIRTTLYGSKSVPTLTKILSESFIGSLDATRQWTPPQGGTESFYIENRINNSSNFMTVMVNPNISRLSGTWTSNGVTNRTVTVDSTLRKAYSVGPVVLTTSSSEKIIGNTPSKLDRSLRLAENKDQINIDIVVDGGLSTVWAGLCANNSYATFDDTKYVEVSALADQTTGTSADVQNNWETITNKFTLFVGETRKDCIFISDPLRYVFVQGRDYKTLSDPNKNFSEDIYWPLKNLYAAVNSNYACTYGNWVKNYDSNIADFVWLPFSGYEAAIMARTDSASQPWTAAAGLNNGIVRDVVDIAINPHQKQRDFLYKINVNPVVFYPGDGYTVWGQKTLQKKPSAFDRINVRRLFLTLEKATLAVMRYFVFEPNTIFTRTRVVNILKPIFEIAKNNQGVYDYLIVCDERNNTGQVIDNNELVVDLYIKPVRTAEFITCNFIATRTDQNFTELL